jgi:hypothetical protein
MGKVYPRDFNSPKEFSLGDIKKDKFGKIIQIEFDFKDAGYEYNFKLLHPHKPMKYNGTGNSAHFEWDNLREELSIAEITRIVVQKNSNSTSISFQRYDDIVINIICKNIIGLPKCPN